MLRWSWRRILKLACKVECPGHDKGQRIDRAVTIKAVIAWRLVAVRLLGREARELPAEVFFTCVPIPVLQHFAESRQPAGYRR